MMFNYNRKNDGLVEMKGLVTDEPQKALNAAVSNLNNSLPAILILHGNTADSYDSILNTWKDEFIKNHILPEGASVKKYDILPILSGYGSISNAIRKIMNDAAEYRLLHCISGFHRMSYNSEGTLELIDFILNNPIAIPLVLNIPDCIWETVRRLRPALTDSSICLHLCGKLPEITAMPTASEAADAPWYTKNLSLFQKEKDGVEAYLHNLSAEFELASMPHSKRLYWKATLLGVGKKKRDIFTMDIKLVYARSFGETNPAVGISINNRINEEILMLIKKHCVDIITNDEEFDTIYIVKPVYRDSNPSAAVAALEGFLEIFNNY